MKTVLYVNEIHQGYRKEISDVEELKKEILKEINENVLEISITREPQINDSQDGCSTSVPSDNRICR